MSRVRHDARTRCYFAAVIKHGHYARRLGRGRIQTEATSNRERLRESGGVGGFFPVARGAGRMPLVQRDRGGDSNDGLHTGTVEATAEIIVLLPITQIRLVETVDSLIITERYGEVRAKEFGFVRLRKTETTQKRRAYVAAMPRAKNRKLLFGRSDGPETTAHETVVKRFGLFAGEVNAEADNETSPTAVTTQGHVHRLGFGNRAAVAVKEPETLIGVRRVD